MPRVAGGSAADGGACPRSLTGRAALCITRLRRPSACGAEAWKATSDASTKNSAWPGATNSPRRSAIDHPRKQ
jgi:hypothetical protein